MLRDQIKELFHKFDPTVQQFISEVIDLEQSNISLERTRIQKESDNGQLAELKRSIKKAQKTAQREQFLSKKLELAEKSSDALKEMYQTFADDMRQKIEAKTKEIFQKLAWKEGHFKDVKLGPDFNLEVLN